MGHHPDTGNYALYLDCLNHPRNTTPITFGEAVSGSIPSLAIDFYTFSTTANDTIIIRLSESAGGDFDPQIRLYSPNGTLLKTQSTCCALELQQTLLETGEYLVLICDNGKIHAGGYLIFLQRTNNPGNATPLWFGETINVTIATRAEMDTYTFAAEAGDMILARLRTSWQHDAELRLYAPNRTLVKRLNADWGLELTQVLSESGNYTLMVSDLELDNIGTYTLTLKWNQTPPTLH